MVRLNKTKPTKKWKWGLRVSIFVFLTSSVWCGIAIFHIYYGQSTIDQALQEWSDRTGQSFQRYTQKIEGDMLHEQDKLEIEPLMQHEYGITKMNANENDSFVWNGVQAGDVISVMRFRSIEEDIPLIYGMDSDSLRRGVGYYPHSAQPGEIGNMIVAGHRDTVFQNLGRLDMGDIVEVHTEQGVFKYEVQRTQVVDATDRSLTVHAHTAQLTMITCYPFGYVGPAPQRYIVTADLTQ